MTQVPRKTFDDALYLEGDLFLARIEEKDGETVASVDGQHTVPRNRVRGPVGPDQTWVVRVLPPEDPDLFEAVQQVFTNRLNGNGPRAESLGSWLERDPVGLLDEMLDELKEHPELLERFGLRPDVALEEQDVALASVERTGPTTLRFHRLGRGPFHIYFSMDGRFMNLRPHESGPHVPVDDTLELPWLPALVPWTEEERFMLIWDDATQSWRGRIARDVSPRPVEEMVQI